MGVRQFLARIRIPVRTKRLDKTAKFYELIDREYFRNIERQNTFKKTVEAKTGCPSCARRMLKLIVYKNDVAKQEYEVQIMCAGCAFKGIMRHDGVIVEYADRPS